MITVVIPVYNRSDKLREALVSLTNQTMKKFFVCVCDDASTENIKDVCNEFKDKLKIIYLRTATNQGPGAARQAGLDWCIEYGIDLVSFLDSDDLYFCNTLQTLSYEINHGRFDAVFGNIAVESKNEPQFTIKGENNLTWVHAKMYRVKFLKENHITFPSIRSNEDLAFNLKVRESSDKIYFIDSDLYFWRDDKSSITRCGNEISMNVRGVDYIRAVYDYYKFVFKTMNAKKVIELLANCYFYYERAKEIQNEIPKEIDDMLREMFNENRIQTWINRKNFWADENRNIRIYTIENNKVIFFKESFIEWVHKFNSEVLKNEISSN